VSVPINIRVKPLTTTTMSIRSMHSIPTFFLLLAIRVVEFIDSHSSFNRFPVRFCWFGASSHRFLLLLLLLL